MAIQYQNKLGVPQNAAIALSYTDSNTGKLCFLMGQPKLGNKSNKFVFPGGQVDTQDLNLALGVESKAYQYAAIRELEEETGIDLNALCIKLKFIETLHSKASNGYEAKDVHFHSAHLGTLSPVAASALVTALNPKDDLTNLRFVAEDSITIKKHTKTVNAKQIMTISDLIKNNQHPIADPSKVNNWIMSMTKAPASHSPHSFWAPKEQPQHTPLWKPSLSFNVNLLLMATGVGLLLLGLITSNPLCLLGIVPLLLGIGMLQAALKNNTPKPSDITMSISY